MATYNERNKCPACGAVTTVQITAYGDYDGPAKMYETDPHSCQTCQGIKLATPAIHARLMAMWEQIKAERAEHSKRLEDVRNHSYTEHDLYSVFHTPYINKTLARMYDKELRSHAQHATNKDTNDEWVRAEAAKALAFKVIKIAIGNRKIGPTHSSSKRKKQPTTTKTTKQ
jgi:hypothetical protein